MRAARRSRRSSIIGAGSPIDATSRGGAQTFAPLHLVYHFPGGKEAAINLKTMVPNLTQTVVLEGCGHWIQQERPAEVNSALREFVCGL
jgi:pimeloyl-ACP methyl ester carboxylesterase